MGCSAGWGPMPSSSRSTRTTRSRRAPGAPFSDVVRLADLADEHSFSSTGASSYHELTNTMFLEAGIAPRSVMEEATSNWAKKMVALGLGMAFLPHVAVRGRDAKRHAAPSSSSPTDARCDGRSSRYGTRTRGTGRQHSWRAAAGAGAGASGRGVRDRVGGTAGDALQLRAPRSSKARPEPATRSFTVCETSTSPGEARAAEVVHDAHRDSATLLSTSSHSQVCRPALTSIPSPWTDSALRVRSGSRGPVTGIRRRTRRRRCRFRSRESARAAAAWCCTSNSRHRRSASSAAFAVEPTMSVNRTVARTRFRLRLRLDGRAKGRGTARPRRRRRVTTQGNHVWPAG